MPDPAPQPPDQDCNGETSDGSLCGLTANWGREDPVETNPGRCRYHKDQDVDATPTGTVGYGGLWYGGAP